MMYNLLLHLICAHRHLTSSIENSVILNCRATAVVEMYLTIMLCWSCTNWWMFVFIFFVIYIWVLCKYFNTFYYLFLCFVRTFFNAVVLPVYWVARELKHIVGNICVSVCALSRVKYTSDGSVVYWV